MNEHRISLDLSKEPLVAPVLYLGQGDKLGTTLIVSIYDDGQVPTFESGSTVTLCMKNPGENGGYYEVAGTLEGNEATFLIDEEYAASTSGVSDIAYVEVSTSFNTTSTSRFTYVVFPSAEHGADPSSTYSNGINEAIERAIDAAEAAEGVVLQDVPLMSPTVRGGAQLGDGLEITDGVLSVDPETIDLPVATTSDAGVVIADGTTITVDSDGTLHGANTYTLPPATTSTLGGVIPDGSTITVDSDGTIHGSSSYTLPTMSAIVKGGAKLGGGLSVDSGDVLSVDLTGEDITPDSVTASGEVTATETSGGTTSLHKLTEKADLAVVESRSKCWYGECTTGASVAAKVVTCSGFELVKGAMIAVHFYYSNTATLATLNVNSTGAKEIATGNTVSGQDNFWYAGEIMMFTYDGTYWRPANMAGINALRDSLSKDVSSKITYGTGAYESHPEMPMTLTQIGKMVFLDAKIEATSTLVGSWFVLDSSVLPASQVSSKDFQYAGLAVNSAGDTTIYIIGNRNAGLYSDILAPTGTYFVKGCWEIA